MARTTNYSKKIEKIKSQLDELGAVIDSIQNNSNDAENPSPAINIKALEFADICMILTALFCNFFIQTDFF